MPYTCTCTTLSLMLRNLRLLGSMTLAETCKMLLRLCFIVSDTADVPFGCSRASAEMTETCFLKPKKIEKESRDSIRPCRITFKHRVRGLTPVSILNACESQHCTNIFIDGDSSV